MELKNKIINKKILLPVILIAYPFTTAFFLSLYYILELAVGKGVALRQGISDPRSILFLLGCYSLVYYFVNKYIDKIIKYQNGNKSVTLENTQKNISELQKFIGLSMLLYPIISTIFLLTIISSYPLPPLPPYLLPIYQSFKIVSGVLSLILPCVLMLPFYLFTTRLIEQMTSNVAHSEKFKTISLNLKIGLNVTFTVIGIIIFVVTSNILMLMRNYRPDLPIFDLINILVGKNIIITCFCLTVGFINYILLRKSVSEPIIKLSELSKAVAEGNLNIDVTVSERDEIGSLASSFKQMQNILRNLIDEISLRIENIENGVFIKKQSNNNFTGAWKNLDEGIDRLVQAFTQPINTTTIYLASLSEGNLPKPLEQEYKGEFNRIKNSLNQLIASTHEITGQAKRVSQGDLTVELTKRSDDDVLVESLSEMVSSIKKLVMQISQSAQNVSTASSQLNGVAQQVSSGASQQAASTEEVSASLEQITAGINQNSDNAQEALKIAKRVSGEITLITKAVTETNEAMQNITKKIAIINDIASKTDLLAINAAIEAARAGEFGKGFSVVAGEVRKLAEHSSKAAQQIALVSAESLQKVESSTKLLIEIAPDIQKSSQLVEEIAAANLEQNSGITQVNQALQQLSMVVQQNSATSEEMASASEELSGQALQLLENIKYFKTASTQERTTEIYEIQKNISALQEQLSKILLSSNTHSIEIINKQKESQSNFVQHETKFKGVNLKLDDGDDKHFENF